MFIGHLALGFGAKRHAPRVSLGVLVAAPILADLIWPTLLLLRVEEVRIVPGTTAMTPLDFVRYPWSHSLLMLCVYGAVAGALTWRATRDRAAASIVALLIVSHWVLDFVTHRPDMPLVPWGGPKVGLSLWNHPAATAFIEAAMLAAGALVYFRSTRALDRRGVVVPAAFIAFLALVYFANLSGAPPPGVTALAWVAEATWLFPLWAHWADRHRVPAGVISRGAPAPPARGAASP